MGSPFRQHRPRRPNRGRPGSFPPELEGKYCIVIEGPFSNGKLDSLYCDSINSDGSGEYEDKARAEEAFAKLQKENPRMKGKVLSAREYYDMLTAGK